MASSPENLLSTSFVQRTVQGTEREVQSNEKWELGKITDFIFEGPIPSQTKPLKQSKMIRQPFPCSRNTQAHSGLPGLNLGILGSGNIRDEW